jgi:CubicO group peptidase (beta-lactamase class C family)
MKQKSCFFLFLFILVACSAPKTSAPSGFAWPTQDWSTADPESQGMDSALLAQGVAYAEQDMALHSLLVIRHGVIVSETYFSSYKASTLHELYSVTKSFTATLVGIALDQGDLPDVDQRVVDFFPELTFLALDERKEAMTIKDLLTMTSGLAWQEGDPVYRAMYLSPDWVKLVMDLPMVADPGSEFVYCSGCSHVLAGIVQQATGEELSDFAQANLFKPLGIEKYTWENDAQGISIGGWGLSLSSRDMAKLGYLYLHEGQWDGKQVVSADWVKAATSKQVTTEGEDGYGYQWWVFPSLGGYAALGLYGQTVFVAPEQDLIVVTTAQEPDHEGIFRLIQDFVLKAIQAP